MRHRQTLITEKCQLQKPFIYAIFEHTQKQKHMWDSGATKHLRRRQKVCGRVYISLPTNWNHCGSIFLLLPCYCFLLCVFWHDIMEKHLHLQKSNKQVPWYSPFGPLHGSTIVIPWYVKFSTLTKEYCAVQQYKKWYWMAILWKCTWKCTLQLKFMYNL